MRDSKIIFLMGTLAVLLAALPLGAAITFVPSQPNVEQSVTFTVTDTSSIDTSRGVNWNFGDGTTFTSHSTSTPHIYLGTGTFTVRADYLVIGVPGLPDRFSQTQVKVSERRQVTFSPSAPVCGLAVTFQAKNFLSQSVRWDFDDDTVPLTSGLTVSHIFARPGVYTVTALDNGGNSVVPIRASVTVREAYDFSLRQIQWQPLRPVAGRPVTFEAMDFYTNDIRWNFGDGTLAQNAGPSVIHIFSRSGAFTVQAWDADGGLGPPVTAAVKVYETAGPRAEFHISFLELRFEDGKSYKVVPKNTMGLRAWADLKFEGSGLLQVEWLVDGASWRQETKTLTFARTATIDSGAAGLPAQIPGLHDVSLRILSPRTEFTVPIIRYFVTAGAAAPPQAPRVVMELTAKVGLDGRSTPLAGPSLQIPPGGYGLLQGQLRNESRSVISAGLLRVTVDGRVSDLQIVRNIGPGETRSFLTSIFQPQATDGKMPRTVFLSFYDLSLKPPLLLVARKMTIGDVP